MKNRVSLLIVSTLLLSGLSFSPISFAEEQASVAELKQLVDQQAYKDAYVVGQTMLVDHEGDPEFDLLYGKAALETGHNSEALFTFERLAEDDPSNPRIQLELAKTHFQLGNRDRAKEIFQAVYVDNESLPENVNQQIIGYLSAIEAGSKLGQATRDETLQGFIALMLGNDDNPGSSSGLDVTLLGQAAGQAAATPLTTSTATKPEGTSYFTTQLGALYSKPLGEKTSLNFTGFGQHRNNLAEEAGKFELGTVLVGIDLRRAISTGFLSAGFKYTDVGLDHKDLYTYTDFNITWKQALKNSFINTYTVAFNTGAINYNEVLLPLGAGTYDSKDHLNIAPTRFTLAATKIHTKYKHAGSIYFGSDASDGQGLSASNALVDAEWNARSFFGLTYDLAYKYSRELDFIGGLLYQSSSYDAVHPTINNVGATVQNSRDGALLSLSAGASYSYSKSLKFKGMIATLENDSDLDAYSYDRNTLELGASYQF